MMRVSRCGCGRQAKQARAWLGAILATILAFPVPVEAQAPRVVRDQSSFPTISILEPRNGTIVTREDQGIVITYKDPRDELDLSTFRVFVNGVDRTSEFQGTSSGATWRPRQRGAAALGRDTTQGTARDTSQDLTQQPLQGAFSTAAGVSGLERQASGAEARALGGQDMQQALQQELQPAFVDGQNTIVASIKNLSGNLATASASFVFDSSAVLTTKGAPRSPVERAFLQPPSLPLTETERRGSPAGPSISRDLVQFGYDAFRSLLPTLTPAINLPVSPDYTLGTGDSLVLYVWNIPGGALYDSATLAIDRTGAAFVPRVGSVPLQGLTMAQAEEVLRTRLARYYSGFELRLALGELRAIAVYVLGEVARPGTYTISPFSTVLDGLFAAGGPTKMGTLRAIRISRSGRTVEEVDLYDFLLRGERPIGPPLQAGDTIFVPPIGPVAAITGEVKRPAIYELRPGASVGTLLAMAGGPLPSAQLGRVQIERIQGPKGKEIIDVSFGAAGGGGASEQLRDGDLVTIFPGQDRLQNMVTVEGFVRSPGQYEWKAGMRLSDLVKPETLLPEAYRNRVEVIRVHPDFTREIIPVDLRELWSSNPGPDPTRDVILQPLDKISVQSEVIGPATVTLSGEVKRPGIYAIIKGERLSSVIQRAGGFTDKAYPKAAVFTRESIRKKEKAELDEFIRVEEQRLVAEAAAYAAGGESGAGAALTQRRQLLRLMASRVILGRIVLRVSDLDQFEGSESDIPLEDGDALSVPMRPSSVLVLGSVRNPTAVLYQPGAPAVYYIEKAGGLNKDADKAEVHIVKADGSAISGYTKVREMEPGDSILAPSTTEPKYRPLSFWSSIATVFGQVGLAAASIAVIFR